MESHQLINQDSGNTEWRTPPFITDAARLVMGEITLDPASSPAANESVQAKHIYTKEDNGLKIENAWSGKIFCNPPFGKEHNQSWVSKLLYEYNFGRMEECCYLTFASTSEKWFQPLLLLPQCFLSPRLNYIDPEGKQVKGVTKGSVVTYLGKNVQRFYEVFSKYGVVKVPYAAIQH